MLEAVPAGRILALSAGVVAVLAAGVQAAPLAALLLAMLGLGLLAAALRLERRRNQLFPPRPLDLRRPWGPGYVMILALSVATVPFTVYGPLLMETLFGATPLVAGFTIAVESVSWTLAAIVFAGAGPRLEPAADPRRRADGHGRHRRSRLDHADRGRQRRSCPGSRCSAPASAWAGRS